MKALTIFIALITLVGCGSVASKKDFHQSPVYKKRALLRGNFFKKDDTNFTDKQISHLLNKKVTLDSQHRIAVVKLGHHVQQTYTLGNTFNQNLDFKVSDENARSFKSMIKGSENIKDVSIIPNFMMPKEPNLRNLRDIAALLQSDLLLVILTNSDADFNYSLISKNEAKAQTTLEAVIVDVKTGVIPFTAIASESALLQRSKRDFNNREFRERTLIAAEDKALKRIAEDISSFFNY